MESSLAPIWTPPPVPRSKELAPITWSQIRAFLLKYWLLIVGVFLTVAVSGYATLSLLTELYEVQASVLLKLGRENLDPPATSRNVPLSTGLRTQDVVSEIEILKSPDLIAAVVDEIGPAAFEPHRVPPTSFIGKIKFEAKAVARAVKQQYKETLIALDLKKRLDPRQSVISDLLGNLVIEPRKDSDVIVVTLRTADSRLGMLVVSKLLDQYFVRRIHIRENRGVKDFLDVRANQELEALKKAQSSEMEWKLQKGVVAPQEQRSALLRQIESLSSARDASEREVQSLERQLDETRRGLDAAPKYLRSTEEQTPNPLAQSLKERIAGLQTQRVSLLSKYRPESDPIRNLDGEIASLQGLLAKEEANQLARVTSQINPLRQTLEQREHDLSIRLAGVRAEQKLQDTQLRDLRGQAASLDQSGYRLSSMERDRQLIEQEYLTLMKRDLEADLARQLDRDGLSNVTMVTPPTPTLEPVYPRKLLIMLAVLLVGLGFGVGLALLLHRMDDTMQDAEQLQLSLGLPMLQEFSLDPAPEA